MLDQSLNARLELAALDADTAIESIRQQAAEKAVLEKLGKLACSRFFPNIGGNYVRFIIISRKNR